MNYETGLKKAVAHFWNVRASQRSKQGSSSGVRDYGSRKAVTGGKHLDGFVDLLAMIAAEAGMPGASIHKRRTTLPGFFRPTKDWDLVITHKETLLASIEFKAQVGSFGNNFNNRVEEALGNAIDVLTAYREGKFEPSGKPWLGWLMLLEESPKSTAPVRVSEPHFKVFQSLMKHRMPSGMNFFVRNSFVNDSTMGRAS